MGGFNPYGYVQNPLSEIDPLGLYIFKRWRRGEAIDKPMPDGSPPSWDTVRSRYWKNRYEASKNTNEFTQANKDLMKQGNAPLDEYGHPHELHHNNPQRNGGADVNNPYNLREVTREQHAAIDPHRHL